MLCTWTDFFCSLSLEELLGFKLNDLCREMLCHNSQVSSFSQWTSVKGHIVVCIHTESLCKSAIPHLFVALYYWVLCDGSSGSQKWVVNNQLAYSVANFFTWVNILAMHLLQAMGTTDDWVISCHVSLVVLSYLDVLFVGSSCLHINLRSWIFWKKLPSWIAYFAQN